MKGLELSERYFEEYGRPMLEEMFPELLPYLAVGSVGSGSDRYGYDDSISEDHDFEPGFCIFLPGENILNRKDEFRLERAYAKLPKEFMGVSRQWLSPVGGNRNGVIRTADFYTSAAGTSDGNVSPEWWLGIPDPSLAEAVNGKVFMDNYGEFSSVRQKLIDMPRDARLKKLAGSLLVMAQSGQYNFARCLGHGEPESAQLACVEFVSASMRSWFILHGRYMPYYKWSFRALRELEGGTGLSDLLSVLLYGDNRNDGDTLRKQEVIEEVSALMISELSAQDLTDAVCGDLEKHAYSVNDRISDGNIRNMHILCAV